MQRTLLLITVIWLFVSAAMAQQPNRQPDNADLPARVQQLETEVRTLRVAMTRLQLTLQSAQIAQLESELQQIRAAKQKAEQLEAGRIVQLQQVTEMLSSAALDAETRAEAEALRTALASRTPAHQREELDRRERAVAARLEGEQQQQRQLLKQAHNLGIKSLSDEY
ncbi:MAG TPA: hypothetical protein VFZ34_17740 [Blastocatellia bacterium]|nr:hypothetical protein [Blastocatellia bacterium]